MTWRRKRGSPPSAVSRVIALVVLDITNPYDAQIARGVENAAWEHNHTTNIANSANDVNRERSYADILYENQVDGIILAVTGSGEGEHIGKLASSKPVATVGRRLGRDASAGECEPTRSSSTTGLRRDKPRNIWCA